MKILWPLIRNLRKALGYQMPRAGSRLYNLFYKTAPRHATAALFPGIEIEFDFDDETMRGTFWKGRRFEFPTADVLNVWARKSTHFFDIGANYGFFSYWLISQNPDLSVHCFEPNPLTFKKIESIQQRNYLSSLKAWNIGLGDSPQQLHLTPGQSDSGHSTFSSHPDLRKEASILIDVDTFDHWCERHSLNYPDTPRWIAKIDVEGFELKVLQGMRAALERKVFSGIVVEMNDFTLGLLGATQEDIHKELNQFGYFSDNDPLGTSHPNTSGNAFFVLK